MGSQNRLGGALLFIVLATFTFDFCASACTDTKWSDEPKECEAGMTEIYRNQDKGSGKWSARCCPTGSQEEKDNNLYAEACKSTACAPDAASGMNLCEAGLPFKLFIKGKEIEFEETVRDKCEGANGEDGVIGIEALCCPKNSTETLLTTLYGAEKHEFPHFARLGTSGCGGTLYNSKWVISASHCVVDAQTHQVKDSSHPTWDSCCGTVRFNIEIGDAYTKATYNVKRIVIHPNSSLLKPLDRFSRQYNDVALLELEKDVEFNDNVRPLKISKKGYNPLDHGSHAVIVGFGTTDSLMLSKKLQKANLLIRNKTEVFGKKSILSFMRAYTDQLLPLGGIWEGTANPYAGTGDSGGPAICRDAVGNALLCGITSFTAPIPDCKANLDEENCWPAVYADVGNFSDWIEEVAGVQDDNDVLHRNLYGHPAGERSYLSHVHVTSREGKPCGGTLIDQDIVLTAASCVAEDDGTVRSGVMVTSGIRDLADTQGTIQTEVESIAILDGFERVGKGGGQSTRVKRVVSLVLETWREGKSNKPVIMADPFYNNNLAILKLKGMAKGQPAKIGDSTGEGTLANEVAFPRQNKHGEALVVREFNLLSTTDCQKRVDRLETLGYNITLEDNLLCGVETYSGGSLCDRELGGGLFCLGPRAEEVLCGVQIFRLCEFNVPNAFMDVGKMKDWVEGAKKALKDAKN